MAANRNPVTVLKEIHNDAIAMNEMEEKRNISLIEQVSELIIPTFMF